MIDRIIGLVCTCGALLVLAAVVPSPSAYAGTGSTPVAPNPCAGGVCPTAGDPNIPDDMPCDGNRRGTCTAANCDCVDDSNAGRSRCPCEVPLGS